MTSLVLNLVLICLFLCMSGYTAQQSIISTLLPNNLTYLYASMGDANLASNFTDTNWDLTLFAPSDAAFRALEDQLSISGDVFFAPQNGPKWATVLKYHFTTPSITTSGFVNASRILDNAFTPTTLEVKKSVVGNATVNSTVYKVSSLGSDANITIANITAGNATIHVLDGVLLPFYTTIGSALKRNPNISSIGNITATVANNTAFLNVLNNLTTEYTVLAPVNRGIYNPNAATNATLTKLLNSTIGLAYLWNYHFIPKPVFADLNKAFNATLNQTVVQVTTVSGLSLTLVKEGSNVTIVSPNGNASVISSYNVGITNNVAFRSAIHLISQVLVPPTQKTVRDVFKLRSDIGNFLSVLGNSSYKHLLDDTNVNGTILAPTDAAFNALLTKYPGYNFQQFIEGTAGVEQILNVLVVQTYVSLAGLANDVTNITVKNGVVFLKATKNAVTGAVKFTSQANSANAVGSDYIVGSLGSSGATVIVIDAVLVPFQFDMGAGGGAGGGAALTAASPLVMLLFSLLAVAALQLFGWHAEKE